MNKYAGTLVLFVALIAPTHGFGGDKELGEARYNKSCKNCHGKAGRGVASFPKVAGNPVEYTVEKLSAYRAGIKQGANSALMINQAKTLKDDEIENLAAYLEDAQ